MRLDLDVSQEVFYALARKALEMRVNFDAATIEPEDVACAVLGTWATSDSLPLSREQARVDMYPDRPAPIRPTHSARPRRLYPDGVEGVDLDDLR